MAGEVSEAGTQAFRRGSGEGTYRRKTAATREASLRGRSVMVNRRPARDRPGAVGWRRGS
jgi:hypothetical protein